MLKNIPLFGIYKDERMNAAALEVLNSGQIASGQYINRFTEGFANLVNQKYVVTVNDMSSAIQIALRIIGVGPGDEVLASPFACMSTNAPIATSGAKAVWVDINPDTGTMDPVALEKSITSRTKAVIVYHLAGYPADIQKIADICGKKGIKLIEDCDNALLATINSQQVGTFGDFAVYSFYPNRQINATEGGALCCKNADDAERAVRLRRYGIDLTKFRDSIGEINANCDISEIGWAATLNNLCSAIGYTQLDSVAHRVSETRAIAKELTATLKNIDGIEIVSPLEGSTPSYWALLIKTKHRDRILAELKRRGIQASKLHQRTDIYTGFNAGLAELPNTTQFFNSVIGLPCGWWMSNDDVEIIGSELNNLSDLTSA